MGKQLSKQAGFTIIEVILFLALSAFLLFIALNSISGRSEEVRFTQSIRALESLLQQQQTAVTNGVVESSTTSQCESTGSECVFLGRAIEFTPDTSDIVIHTIMGNRLQADDSTVAVTLFDSRPFTTTDGSNKMTDSVEWGVEFKEGEMTFSAAGLDEGPDNRIIAFVRVPNGTEIFPIGFQAANGANEGALLLDTDCLYNPGDALCGGGSTIDQAFEANLCFAAAGDDRYAYVKLGGEERRQAIKAEFESSSCI